MRWGKRHWSTGKVDMFIGVKMTIVTTAMPQDFKRPVGDHLVGIHVRGSAGTALNKIDDKLIEKCAAPNFLTCLDDGFSLFSAKDIEVGIGSCSCFLDGRKG